jgi:class 3 adenylate cyclase
VEPRAADRPGFIVPFRFKLLLSLLGLVALLLGIVLVHVRRETRRQTELAVGEATRKAEKDFADLEISWKDNLTTLARRLLQSPRIPGAMEAALDEGDVGVLVDATLYEFRLAGLDHHLAVFSDNDGLPLAVLLEGRRLPWETPLVPRETPGAEGLVFCYLVVDGRLWAAWVFPVVLFDRHLGTLLLGFPLDDAVARDLGWRLGAEVSFVAGGRVLAATPGAASPEIRGTMAGTDAGLSPRILQQSGQRWAVFANLLSHEDPSAGLRVTAIPLERVVAPFEKIQRAVVLAGALVGTGALLLSFLLAHELSAPIRELVGGTDRVAGGDYDFQLRIATRDELGLLGESFNAMVHDLRQKERYRSLLDKVVSAEVAREMLRGEIYLGGETRVVTTLFADIRGFTPLTQGMQPEEVIQLLNETMNITARTVESEGGVVDKYIGDAVMAIFGAPVTRGDDALRAVRAAVGIQGALQELDEARLRSGRPRIRMGIGLNTGPVVAGNMGSATRLNYTVVGNAVNVASRLCAAAAPGQILISRSTWELVAHGVEADPLEPRELKGLSGRTELWSVRSLAPAGRAAGIIGAAALCLLLALPLPLARAASPDAGWTFTPSDRCLVASSPGGGIQASFSGRLSLEGYLLDEAPPGLIRADGSFASLRASLLADLFVGDRLYGMLELRADTGDAPSDEGLGGRVEQAFLRLTPFPGHDLHLQYGRFVSPFGAWPQRHDSSADPFIRPPLPYDYRTMICAGLIPRSNDGFIYWRFHPEVFRPKGAPPVWAAPYQVGLMAHGGTGPFSFRAALMDGAPSSEPGEWNRRLGEVYDPSWVLHAGWRPHPAVSLGLSYNQGPYMLHDAMGTWPSGTDVDSWLQKIWGVNAELVWGRTQVRAEAFHDLWQVPNLREDAIDLSWFVEVSHRFLPGLHAALRYGRIEFNRLAVMGEGTREEWDFPVERWQAALGYRIDRYWEIRAEYLRNRTGGELPDPRDNLLSLQLRWGY